MSAHEPSGIPSPPPPRGEREATPPSAPRGGANATGKWPAVLPGTPEHVAHTTYRNDRHVTALELSLGRPPVPATGDAGSGLWARVESGFVGVNVKLDEALVFIKAETAARAGRRNNAAELSWVFVKALVPILIAALIALASGHLK